jgi:hypothetical protein
MAPPCMRRTGMSLMHELIAVPYLPYPFWNVGLRSARLPTSYWRMHSFRRKSRSLFRVSHLEQKVLPVWPAILPSVGASDQSGIRPKLPRVSHRLRRDRLMVQQWLDPRCPMTRPCRSLRRTKLARPPRGKTQQQLTSLRASERVLYSRCQLFGCRVPLKVWGARNLCRKSGPPLLRTSLVTCKAKPFAVPI